MKLPTIGQKYEIIKENPFINLGAVLRCDAIDSYCAIFDKDSNGGFISWPIDESFWEYFKEVEND